MNRLCEILFTGKNNGFPVLDILGYLKNTHKNPKFGNQVPWLGLVSLFQIWDFWGYSLNTLKYPKMGIRHFFLWVFGIPSLERKREYGYFLELIIYIFRTQRLLFQDCLPQFWRQAFHRY